MKKPERPAGHQVNVEMLTGQKFPGPQHQHHGKKQGIERHLGRNGGPAWPSVNVCHRKPGKLAHDSLTAAMHQTSCAADQNSQRRDDSEKIAGRLRVTGEFFCALNSRITSE